MKCWCDGWVVGLIGNRLALFGCALSIKDDLLQILPTIMCSRTTKSIVGLISSSPSFPVQPLKTALRKSSIVSLVEARVVDASVARPQA